MGWGYFWVWNKHTGELKPAERVVLEEIENLSRKWILKHH
jgi:hypothetical protein